MWRWIAAIFLCLSALAARASDAPEQSDVKNPELRSELLQRMKADQDARFAEINWRSKQGVGATVKTDGLSAEQNAELEKIMSVWETTDRENAEWLKKIVEDHGWPCRTLVGADGEKAAWLLVQHAVADRTFQRKCLELMAKLPKEEVSQRNMAYLTDRVLLAEGKKQVYGTQFVAVDGEWRPSPLEDEANVDKRRADVGLRPLAEYAAELEKVYGRP